MNRASQPDSPTEHLRLEGHVPDALGGERADRIAATLFADYSRSRLSEWMRSGALTVDDAAVKPSDRLHGGETIRLDALIDIVTRNQAEPIALDVRHADADILLINKPVGLVVHPGAGNPTGTLENALLHFDPALGRIPRAGIVHRLDKDTSGLMVVARTLPAHAKLVEMLGAHALRRQYVALVLGMMVAGGSVDAAIGRHPTDRLRQAVRDEDDGGRRAVTHYRVRERFRAHTLVECQLETGRTHQIRVHMAHLKYPLVGDRTYGGGLKLPKAATAELTDALRDFRRQALHAERLSFAHPRSGRPIDVTAPWPADLEHLVAAMRTDTAAAK